MKKTIAIGDTLPPFFLKDHEGYDVSDEDIIGSAVVIFFYPKDETPGCTKEVCDFQKNMKTFDEELTILIGVSPDSVESHKKFRENHSLAFNLLADEKKDMARMFGVLNKEGKIIRSTFVIDPKGVVRWIEKPVEIEGHTERVLKAVKKYCKNPAVCVKNIEKDYEEFLKDTLSPKKKK